MKHTTNEAKTKKFHLTTDARAGYDDGSSLGGAGTYQRQDR